MAELKTKPTDGDVGRFLASIEDEVMREDCVTLVELMGKVTNASPRLWGPSIVGFGEYRYRYASGREGTWFTVGFAPRSKRLTLYLMSGFEGYEDLLARLGRHSLGKSCLYVRRLADVDLAVLTELVTQSVRHLEANAAP